MLISINKLNIGEIEKNDLKVICEKISKKIHKAIITGNCYLNYFNEELSQEIREFILQRAKYIR